MKLYSTKNNNNFGNTSKPYSGVISSYALRKDKPKRSLLQLSPQKILLILGVCVITLGALGYSVALTVWYHQSQELLTQKEQENQLNQEKIQQFTQIANQLNQNMHQVVNKNNELRSILGVKELEVPSFEKLTPIEEKEIEITNQEMASLLKNIRSRTTITNNAEVGEILFGDDVVLTFVSPNDIEFGAGKRAHAILQRIRKIIYDRVIYDKIVIRRYEENEYGILASDRLLFSIGEDEAKYYNMELLPLTKKFAQDFHRALLKFNKEYLLVYLKKKIKEYKSQNQKDNEINRISSSFDNVSEAITQMSNKANHFETTVRRHKHRYQCTPSIRPLNGQISSKFGYRMSPFSGKLRYHDGLDMLAMTGTPVKATADGYVDLIGWYGGYGYTIRLNHGYETSTLYGHLKHFTVKRGQFVKKGQIIARSGNSGLSTGPHLHYEVQVKSKPVNPEKFFNIGVLTARNLW